jgi:two-component system OmpR family response regulator
VDSGNRAIRGVFFHLGRRALLKPRRTPDVRILVVDDDADGREAMGALLSQAGLRVELAGSVSEARGVLRHFQPDIVVSDLAMPGEDGFDLLHELQSLEAQVGRHIGAVAMTALSDPDVRRLAVDAGFDAYFVKPCDALTIFAALAQLSPGRRAVGRR